MLRIEVMGLQDSVTRQPTTAELDRMAGILDEAMQEGYLGLSTDGLPLHFLANEPNLNAFQPNTRNLASTKDLPTWFASTIGCGK